MADPVVKLAQPGYDARTAGDENLIYSSKWPLLKIYKQGSFTLSNFSAQQTITTHDLGYTPFFWWFSNQNIEGWEGLGVTRTSQPRGEFHGDIGNGSIKMNDSRMYFDPINTPPGSTTIYYYIFALPLTENYTAPQIKTGGLSSLSSGSQVLKLAKANKDIKSFNLEDYIIHSDCRSPMLHAVKNAVLGESTGGTLSLPAVTVNHNLGYKPLFFGFFKQTDGSYILLYGTAIFPSVIGFLIDEQKVQYIYPSAGTISIVVLKDPFNVDYSIRVNV